MHASRRGRFRQAGLFVGILITALASNPGSRAAAQSPAMRWDGLLELISGRYNYLPPVIEPPTPADSGSTMSRHGVTADGRYILFNSDASNIGMGYSAPALYIRDRRSSETRVLMAGPALNGTISADGNHIAFEVCDQYGRPQPRPDNLPVCDVFGIELQTWQWNLLSSMPDGNYGDEDSRTPVLSSNGRFAVFRSKSANLSGGTQGVYHLVLRDRDPDGNGVYDEPGSVTLDTVSAGGPDGNTPGNADSDTAEVSDDGRFVAFRSLASNLVAGDSNQLWDVFIRDRQTRQTKRINLRSGIEESFSPIDSPQISMTPDGRYVAYTSADPLLAPASYDDVNGVNDVFVYDRVGNSTSRVDVGWGPPVASGLMPGNAPTEWPTLSADGRYVSVQSDASNVEVPPATPGTTHAYVVDRLMQTVTRISLRPDGVEPDRAAARPAMSADGSLVTFFSSAFNLSPDIFTDAERIYAAVHFDLSPSEALIPGSGGTATFAVTTQQHTQWWLDWTEQWPYWLILDAAPVGVGDGTLRFRIDDANPTGTRRGYTVQVKSKTSLVTQLEGMSLTAVSPAQGPDTGGTRVTISGTGFEPGAQVVFDGYQAQTEFVDPTTLVATTPAHAPATVWVAVFSADYRQNAWIDRAFHYIDTTPPLIWTWADGEQGDDGWFRNTVYVSFAWWDPESEVTSNAGCDPLTITADTPGTTFTCTATSEGGTGSGSITVKRDAAPPTVQFATPAVRQLFKQGSVAELNFSCTDTLSGVDQCGVSVQPGAPLDTMAPGWTTVYADARDVAGNSGWSALEYAVSTDACVPDLANMVGWWRMEGNTRNTRSNITSPATRVGLASDVFVEAIAGQGYEFDGSGYLNTGFAPRIPGDLRYAIAAWVNPSANNFATILRKKDQYSIARTGNGTLAWAFRNYYNSTLSYFDTGVAIPLNVWTHLVVVLDGAEVRTYLNGRLAHRATSIGDVYTWDSMSDPVTIGGAQDRGEYFRGALDELQIFEHSLDAGHIEQLFLAGAAGACPPKATQFYWTPPVQATYLDPTYTVEVKLLDEYGQPVVGRAVHLESLVGAAPYSTSTANLVTDANGFVSWNAPLKDAPPGLYTDFLSATFDGDTEYVRAYAEPEVLVNKATPVITWAVPAAITFGTALSSSQLNATANVPGSFSYSPGAGTQLPAGSHDLAVAFTPSSTAYYNSASAQTILAIDKATPSMAIIGGTFTYDGQPHPATGTVSGIGGASLGSPTFTYNGSSAAPVAAGTYDVIATFPGNDNYLAASTSATLTITKVSPVLSWSTPAAIVYGTALDAAQLNATANVPGTFAYAPSAGTILGAGTGQILQATFTPTDTSNYSNASISTSIDVNKATASVTVTGGTHTYDGQPHSASGSVTGVGGVTLSSPTFTYNGSSAVPVNAGSYEVVASFAGDANYQAASATATIVIGQAAPTLSWSEPASIVYGTVLSAVQLNASSSVPGTFAYAPAAGTTFVVGNHPLSATFTPADSTNYSNGTVVTSIAVTPAALSVRANDAVKRFGAPLPALSASFLGFVNGETPASLGGALVLATAATQQSAVGTYPIVPSGLTSSNYSIVFLNGTLSVVRGAVSVTAASTPETSGLNQPMTFTASVTAALPAVGSPGGSIEFFDGATLLGTAPLVNGTASLATAGLAAGAHAIEARYTGDTSFEPGSGATSHAIANSASTPVVALTSSRNPSNTGQTVSFTANVSMSAGPVEGNVEFWDGGLLLGTSAISAGRATFTTTTLANGSHAMTARYSGSASAPPSISNVLVQAVGGAGWKDRTSTASLAASSNPSTLGSSVTFTATISGSSGTPTGRVLFMVNGSVIGDPAGVPVTTVSSGTVTAELPVPNLAHGVHKVTIAYLGDANYKGSTVSLSQTVN